MARAKKNPETEREKPIGRAQDSVVTEAEERKLKSPQPPEGAKKLLLEVALARFRRAAEAEARVRREATDALRFVVGDQWDPEILKDRQVLARPCLTINKLPGFIRQVTNDYRKQRPAAQISPNGSGADPDTAEVLEGLIRHIEKNAYTEGVDGEVADDVTFDSLVKIGFGHQRIVTKYVDDAWDSLDQDIYIVPIMNPFTVYTDPAATLPDRSDAKWRFITVDVPRQDWIKNHPRSYGSATDFATVGDENRDWATNDTIREAEYFYLDEEVRELALLEDGTVVRAEEVGKDDQVKETRKKIVPIVCWARLTATDVLEERAWVGRYIPILSAYADETIVDGKRHLSGMVKGAMDPQRAYNYWESAATEMIALGSKAPYMVAEGQVEGHENDWGRANVDNQAYLTYKPTTVDGQVVPPPQRNTAEPPIQAMSAMVTRADADLQGTIGLYAPSLGAPSPEQSGKAILARQKQGETSTLNFSDNMARMLRRRARVLLDLIPRIYDTPRVARIIAPDGKAKHVATFSSANEAAPDHADLLKQYKKIYDIGLGRYDVSVTIGPSYQTRRQEAVASMMALIEAAPQAVPLIADLVVRDMDWPQHEQVADRLKMGLLPPQIQEAEQSDDPRELATQLQAKLAQATQQLQLLGQTAGQLAEEKRTKQVEQNARVEIAKYQIDSEEKLKKLQLENQLTIAEITTKSQEAQTRFKLEQDMWQELHGSAHEVAMASTAAPNGTGAAGNGAGAQPTNTDQTPPVPAAAAGITQ